MVQVTGPAHEQTGAGGPVEWHKMGEGWSWSRKQGSEDDRKKIERYKDEQKEIEEKAKELERSSDANMHRHVIFARSVTT